jgi:PAS domain S-box-containing protein
VWTTDRELRITSVAGTAEGALGLSRDELIGLRITNQVQSHDGDEASAKHERALAGETMLYEATWQGRVYQCRLEPLHGSGGDIRGVIGVGLDVTDVRHVEEARLAGEERLRTLIEASPDPIFLKDAEGCWLEVNEAALKLFQLDGVDYRGKSEAELSTYTPFYAQALLACPESDRAAWEAGKLVRTEENVPQPDGSVRAYDVFKVPVFHADGRRKGLVVLGREFTERKRAEEERDRLLEKEQAARAAAERAERRSAFLAEASRVLSSTLDRGDTVARLARLCVPFACDWCAVWVRGAEGSHRLTGFAHEQGSRELPEALSALVFDAGIPDGVARVLRTGEPIVRTGLETAGSGVRLAALGSRDERDMRLLDSLGLSSYMAVPLVARGKTLGVIAFALSRPERSFAPDDISLAEDLACRAALALSNALLYEEAQEAIRARDEFLSIASHELRTPCTSLRLGVQTLLRHVRGGSLERLPAAFLERILETSDRQSKHLASLIDRLLDVSRIQAGQLELEVEEVDLAAVSHEVLSELRDEVARTGSTVTIEAQSPVMGMWDRGRLAQVVTNLLSNALKYGSGQPVRVKVWADGSDARVSVEDGGIGIAEETQQRIFERFERAVSARHYGGLGLGLYIVRQIVEAHGGDIALESLPGKGSTFTVEIPRALLSYRRRAGGMVPARGALAPNDKL